MNEPLITRGELEALKRLPRHEPGKFIDLKLSDLPDYLDLHGLVVTGMSAGGVLLVKKEEQKGDL